MKHESFLITVSIAASLAIISGIALSATQDKYSVKVPGGLGFSDFNGYESWQLIAVSHSGDKLVGVLGDPATVEAFKAGVPDNGEPFPDGARMAKIHWNSKTNETEPGKPTIPDSQHDLDFMLKDSKRFADSWLGLCRVRVRRGVEHVQACRFERQAAAGPRRQVRLRVPQESREPRLRFHAICNEVSGVDRQATRGYL